MNAKRLLVAAAGVIAISSTAFAQFPKEATDAGITVSPWPFTQTQAITISVDATKTWPKTALASDKQPLKGAAEVNIHGGVNLGKIPGTGVADADVMRWQKVQGDWRSYPAKCKFTKTATDKFELKLTPSTHFLLAATDVISEIDFVLNDGANGTKSGGTAPAAGKETEGDGRSDIFVPLNGTVLQFPKAVSDAGITVSPWPFTQTQAITISVDATKTWPKTALAADKQPLKGAAEVNIHGGVNLGKIPAVGVADADVMRWQKVQGDWRSYPAKCKFTKTATDKFELKMTPSTHFLLAATDVITEIDFVLNDGANGTKSGGTAPAAGKETEGDGRADIFVPLTATAPTSVRNTDIFTAAMSYPNPATDVVNINFGLKNTANVTLKIFNAQGVEVATLLDGNTMSGNALHIMQWDVTNVAGKKVPSGAYFFRLMVNGVTETGKIMVN